MNKIKRKSLWLKKSLAIKKKKKKNEWVWDGPEKVKQCFLKQDISWSTFIGFWDLPTPRWVALSGWRVPPTRMEQVVLDYMLPVARMILTWLLTYTI